MAAPSFYQLNAGAGGDKSAAFLDSGNIKHQLVTIETQVGGADPVPIGTGNPMPIQGPVASLQQAFGFPVQIGGVFNTVAPTLANGQISAAQLDASGNLCVNLKAGAAAGGTSSNVGSAVPGIATAVGFSDGVNLQLGRVDGSGNVKVNIAAGGVPSGVDNSAFTAGATNGLPFFAVFNDGIGALTSGNEGAIRCTSDRKVYVAVGAAVSGGWTPSKLISANTTNATSLKGSPGQIGFISATNNGGSAAYLKIYNKASAPTVGTDVPVQVYMLPAGGGNNPPLAGGIALSTGIAFAITGGAADADTTAVAASQVQVNFGYA